jgi:PAS domain S-box-containing protein
LIHSNETLETQVEQRTQELSEALQEHRNVMETVPDILFRVDMSGRLVQWNRKMETVTGRTPEELRGKSVLDLFAEDEKCVITQAIAQAFLDGYAAVEGSLLGTNGVATLHQFSVVPLQNAAGEAIGLTGMGRDITERRRSEINLLESETRYRGLVDHSPEAIIVYSEDRFVYANAASVKLFAATCAEELIGRLIFDFVHPDNRSLAQLRAARSQKKGETSPLTEQKYVRLDGEVIIVEAVSTGIIYQGKPAGQVLIRDITERKKAEEKILALNAEMVSAYDATIEGWSRALDLRDHETDGHSRRVTELTLRLALAVGIPSEELIHIRRGALLHDIGKMGVPDRILLKPGPLDDDEWEIMRRHPELARTMLAPTEFLHPALDIPYYHHEKWDGTGYPCGLRGEDIPLPARLFALVDVWDALTSDRPYRSAWPRERVLDHLRSLSGSHFDPAIVSVFLRMLEADALPEVFVLPPAHRLAA